MEDKYGPLSKKIAEKLREMIEERGANTTHSLMQHDLFVKTRLPVEEYEHVLAVIDAIDPNADAIYEIIFGHFNNMSVALNVAGAHPVAYTLIMFKTVLELFAHGCYVSRGNSAQIDHLVKFLQECVPILLETPREQHERPHHCVPQRTESNRSSGGRISPKGE